MSEPTRVRRRLLALIGAVTVAVGLTAFAAAPSSASPSTASTPTQYVVDQPLCSVPANPQAVRCYAVKQVRVPKGTLGARAVTTAPQPSLGPAGGYTPDDLALAYGFNPGLARSNQLVAVVNWYRDPNVVKDLDTFDSHYKLPKETSSSFRVVSQTGGSTAKIPASTSSAGEQSLDVESIRGVCHTCRIVLIEANAGTDANLSVAENEAAKLGATEISNSYGEPEPKSIPASVVAAYNHPGIVITASTGDDGWDDWDYALSTAKNAPRPPGTANYPATSPYVVAVGGTALGLFNSGARGEEIVWNEDGLEGQSTTTGAGGSGCSKLFAAPAWQAHQAGYAAAGCNGKRLTADVSALADPNYGFDVYDSYGQPGWVKVGGTSLSAPVTAAMYALAGGAGGAAYPASSLYVNSNVYPTSVFDVVPVAGAPSGNGFCGGDTTANCGNATFAQYGKTHNPNALGSGTIDCSFPRNTSDPAVPPTLSSECNTVKGYDGPTGVGTPNSLRLFTRTNPALTVTHPTAPRLKVSGTYTAKAAEPVAGTKITSYAWSWGDGTSTTTTTAATSTSVKHTFTKAGTYAVRLTVSDSRYQRSVKTTTITVGRAASIRTTGPTSLRKAHPGSFSASRTTVPNTGAKISHVTWSWGDHRTSAGTSAKHTWTKTGTYTITVSVLDSTGVTTRATRHVKVTA